MSETGYVYVLKHPDTDKIRYVGATKNLKQRFSTLKAGVANDELNEWIQNLKSKDKEPKMETVYEVDIDDVKNHEQKVLDELKNKCELFNKHYKSSYSSHRRKPENLEGWDEVDTTVTYRGEPLNF